jgi:hypothetical protein
LNENELKFVSDIAGFELHTVVFQICIDAVAQRTDWKDVKKNAVLDGEKVNEFIHLNHEINFHIWEN